MPRVAFVILLLAMIPPGCATTPTADESPSFATDPLAAVPIDFSIDLTILTGAGVGPHAEVHLRPSRYVLFPDGSLHFGLIRKQSSGGMPDLTRRLTRPQMTEVWSLARQIGYADPARGDEPINLGTVRPEDDEVAYLITFSGDNDRWQFITRSTNLDAPDSAAEQLVHELARLAWATEAVSVSNRPPPRRYDFGPDPYARYRNR